MAEPTGETVAEAIGSLYDAAYDVMTWPEALAALAALFDGSRAWLFHVRGADVRRCTSVDDPGFHSAAALDVIVNDPLLGIMSALPAGAVMRHSDLEDMAAYRRRPLFGEWLRPRDVWFGLQAVLASGEQEIVIVDVSHDRRRGDFSDQDRRLLAHIGRHILRAGEISAMRARACGAVADAAMIAVDRHLRVVRINDAARADLDCLGGRIAISAGALRIVDADGQRRLRALVAAALDPARGDGGGVCPIEPKTGAARAFLSVSPLREIDWFGFPAEPLAAIHIKPPDSARLARGALIDLYGVQPTHAGLASALLTCQDLRSAAAARGLSYASARTYLEQVFRKTGVTRQSELVALLKDIAALPIAPRH